MATVTQPFSLFPAPVPRIALPNPYKRKPSLAKEVNAEVTVVSVQEEEQPVPQISVEHKRNTNPFRDPSLKSTKALPGPPPPSDKTSAQKSKNGQKHVKTVADSPEPPSLDSGYRSGGGDNGPDSPVVPIRSMFPSYNPNVPLSQQSYGPQRPIPAYVSDALTNFHSREDYRSSLMTPIDRALGRGTAPPSIANFAMDALNLQFSTKKELERLWDATQGLEPNNFVRSFSLELARPEEAVFTFGADPSSPFYSLTTFDTSELSITKTDPRKRSVVTDVALASLEPGSRRLPPEDGLITFIFPKQAATLAINQSSALAREHQLAPTHRDEVEATAIKRAAAQEASNLRWNHLLSRYELEHAAIGRNARGPNFVQSPASPEDVSRPVVHITVSVQKPGPASNCATLPVINVVNPRPQDQASVLGEMMAGIRSSIVPQSDSNGNLASLDFNTRTLHVDAAQILELMPSLFAIDSVVAAILSVAVADEATNPIMADMELWTPRPRAPGSVLGGSVSGRSMTSTGATIYATIAEREEAEQEARVARQEHERDVRTGGRPTKPRSWFGHGSKSTKVGSPQQKHSKQIVVDEFDLEKLGHYQRGKRAGQQLPGVTRTALSLLVGSLKLAVFLLTTIAKFLAWLMVTATRGVTSEKF